jgi:hypothetical protein
MEASEPWTTFFSEPDTVWIFPNTTSWPRNSPNQSSAPTVTLASRRGSRLLCPVCYMIGAPAAWSFGALMQFVSGTRYASQALMQSIAGKG